MAEYQHYRIKEYREALNLTQEELAEKSGVSRTIISQLETGRRFKTGTDTLLKLSKALKKPMKDIFLP
ncbi:helix-turn-helix transcriptional regulator [Carnobacteriaceae bacterium zg-ZUI240]|nr:helix-turn-helix transcriptional regulator [Carnobacteriaceae bacterium zg-ZUI240]